MCPKTFHSRHTAHGITHEPVAIDSYHKYMHSQKTLVHAFKSGFVVCTNSPILGCSPDGKVIGHVGWSRQSTASYYMQLSKVMSEDNSPSLALTGQEVNNVDLGDLYQNCNTLINFSSSFSALGPFFGEWEGKPTWTRVFPFPIPVSYTEVEWMDVA